MILILKNLIKDAVGAFHKSGTMHQLVGEDVGQCYHIFFIAIILQVFCFTEAYFEENKRLKPCLERLLDANKQLFLITNSSFWYVDRGMTYLLGKEWREFFDVIICQARKPSFFGAQIR